MCYRLPGDSDACLHLRSTALTIKAFKVLPLKSYSTVEITTPRHVDAPLCVMTTHVPADSPLVPSQLLSGRDYFMST